LTYGLGTDNKNLPGFVVLCPQVPTTVGPPLWSSGFLPPVNQATYVSTDTRQKNFDPYKLIPNIHNDHFDMKQQRHELDLIKKLDELNMAETQADPQLEATIGSMETAYRMQTERQTSSTCARRAKQRIKMYGEAARHAAV